jgi:hypothetical protein
MGTLLLIAGGYLGWQTISCLIWPYVPCGVCSGRKAQHGPGLSYRRCWRCDGEGEKLRRGARIIRRIRS